MHEARPRLQSRAALRPDRAGGGQRPSVVASFDRSATHYDRMVWLNPGYHQELRRAATALQDRISHVEQPSLLDLACGSGASTRALVDAVGPRASVLGLDFSAGMLAQAESKTWPSGVRFARAESGALDVDAWGRESHDGVLACYLFRNVAQHRRDLAVQEVFDLLRPGGWLVAQEYSVAGDRDARLRWDVISHALILPLGTLVDRNPAIYRYLWRSVVDFDAVPVFAGRLAAAGFTDVAHRSARGWQRGILHTFVARKPTK